MVRITATQFQRNFGRYQDIALQEPVTVTKDGRDRTVTLSAREYERLKRRDRSVLGVEQLSETDLLQIAQSQPPASAARFDDELSA